MEINEHVKRTLTLIGKAVKKGVTEDMRFHMDSSNNFTNNAVPFLRGDYINTNLNNMLADEDREVKTFPRCYWIGVLVIDKKNRLIFSICSQKTLDRISKNKIRKRPHYTQTLLNTVNRGEKAPKKQMPLFDGCPSPKPPFSKEAYEQDFLSIMEAPVSYYDGYRLWMVAYETDHFNLTAIKAVLMDGEFNVVQKVSILEMLKPNFGDLTSVKDPAKEKNDVRNLISVKPGLVGSQSSEPEKRTAILLKPAKTSKAA